MYLHYVGAQVNDTNQHKVSRQVQLKREILNLTLIFRKCSKTSLRRITMNCRRECPQAQNFKINSFALKLSSVLGKHRFSHNPNHSTDSLQSRKIILQQYIIPNKFFIFQKASRVDKEGPLPLIKIRTPDHVMG